MDIEKKKLTKVPTLFSLLKYLGTNVRRTPQSGGMSIKGDIIDINPDSAAYQFHFEVKDQKKLMIPKLLIFNKYFLHYNKLPKKY